MPELLILADDLTGALDSTVQFVGHTTSIRVLPRLSNAAPADVLGVNLRTRDARAETVQAALRAAWNRRGDPAPRTYLKVDSALRGHIGPMVSTLLAAGAADLAVVAPAFPARSRTTRDGKQYMPGFSDARGQVDIVASLQGQGLTVEHVSVSDVRAGAPSLGERLCRVRTAAAVVDAERDNDLRTLARAIAERPDILPVGSAGLARAIAHEWFRLQVEPPDWDPVRGNVLVVAGSCHHATRAQIRHLAELGSTTLFDLPPIGLPSPAGKETLAQQFAAWIADFRAEHDIRQASQTGSNVVLATAPSPSRDADELRDTGFADALTRLAKVVVDTNDVEAIIVTGGYTAARLCDALAIQDLTPVAELQPGIALSRLHLPQGGLRWLVTKAGSFGDEQSLHRIIKHLRDGSRITQ